MKNESQFQREIPLDYQKEYQWSNEQRKMIKHKRMFAKRQKIKEEHKKILKLMKIALRKKLEDFGLRKVGN